MAVDLSNKAATKTMKIKLVVNMLAEIDKKLTQCGPGSILEVSKDFGNSCITFNQAVKAEANAKLSVEPLQRVTMLPPVDGNTGERFESWEAYNKWVKSLDTKKN